MWRVENQTLVAINPDGQGFGFEGRGRLLTERSFKEFIFRFEYQSSPEFDFSAVWWTLPGELPRTFRPARSLLGRARNRGGRRFSSKVKRSELKGGDEWNVVEIEARDGLIRISVNGKEIVRKVLDEKPAEPTALKTTKPPGPFPRAGMDRRNGRVGFEVRKGTGRFRNIEIEALLPSTGLQPPSPDPAPEEEEGLVEQEADPPNPRPTVRSNQPKLITNSIGMKLVLIPAIGEFLMRLARFRPGHLPPREATAPGAHHSAVLHGACPRSRRVSTWVRNRRAPQATSKDRG